MINRLKGNISLTLVEVLVAMLILSTATAGVLGSFSYAFKFIKRAGIKLEAMNYGRKTEEAFRAIWLSNVLDSRLADQPAWTNVNTAPIPNMGTLVNAYDKGFVYYTITAGAVGGSKQINIKVQSDGI